ncbi:MAG: hypothetical protein R3F61_37415 [Myxococcota bacterium]
MPTDDDGADDATSAARPAEARDPAKGGKEPAAEEREPEVDPEEVGRWRRFTRRLLDRKELADDTRELLAAVLSTSDKAKSELVRMTGREVRHYLDGLALKDDLLDIATNYKLEVHASFHLEPIAKALKSDKKPKAAAEDDED